MLRDPHQADIAANEIDDRTTQHRVRNRLMQLSELLAAAAKQVESGKIESAFGVAEYTPEQGLDYARSLAVTLLSMTATGGKPVWPDQHTLDSLYSLDQARKDWSDNPL